MPAGVSWSVYLRYSAAALVSALAGAQVVHSIYRPLDDLPEYIEKEKQRLKREQDLRNQERGTESTATSKQS